MVWRVAQGARTKHDHHIRIDGLVAYVIDADDGIPAARRQPAIGTNVPLGSLVGVRLVL